MTNLRSLALFLLLLAPITVRGEQYLVVLKPGTAAEPDLKALGAVEEHRWRDRIQVRVDASQLAALLAHPRVDYVQEVLAPGEKSSGSAANAPIAANSGGTTGTWASGDFTYDGAANIIRIGNDTYTHDALGRVVRADVTSGGALTADVYHYDAFGNLYRRTTTGASGTSEQPIGVAWQRNQIVDGSYDGAGNLTGGAGAPYSYGWDAMKMMASLGGNGRNDIYIYTAGDERIATKAGNTWKWTLRNFDGGLLRVYESTDGSAWLWVEDVVHRDRQVAGTERPAAQGGRRHFHLDHLGTTRLITGHDGRGVSQHDYLPFGIELTSIRQEQDRGHARENALRFVGHERDFTGGTLTENTDSLDYMHARYYKSTLARFLSVDRARADATHPQSWNRYTYAANNAIKYVDKDGNYYELASAADRKFFVDAMVRGSRNKAAREMMQRHAADPYKMIRLATGNLPPGQYGDASRIHGPHSAVRGNLFPGGVTATVDARKLDLVSYPTPTISVFHELRHADMMIYQGMAAHAPFNAQDQVYQHPVTGAITTNSVFEQFGRAAEYNNDDPMNTLTEAQVNAMVQDPGDKPKVEPQPPCTHSILCIGNKGN